MADDQLDAAIATLEDEEAAHQDTLRLWQEAKAQLARAEKVITKVRELEPVWCRGTELEIVNAVEELFDMRAEYDRPSAPLDGRETDG